MNKPKIIRKDVDLSLQDVLIVTGPDGSKFSFRWSADLQGYEVALQVGPGGAMCPYIAVLPSATNTITLCPTQRR